MFWVNQTADVVFSDIILPPWIWTFCLVWWRWTVTEAGLGYTLAPCILNLRRKPGRLLDMSTSFLDSVHSIEIDMTSRCKPEVRDMKEGLATAS